MNHHYHFIIIIISKYIISEPKPSLPNNMKSISMPDVALASQITRAPIQYKDIVLPV